MPIDIRRGLTMKQPASPPQSAPSEQDRARAQLEQWRAQLRENPFLEDRDYQHTLKLYFEKRILDERVRHFHGIWHLFVLAGSISHYFTIFFYVL